MTMDYPKKAVPQSIAVFGAGGRLGKPVARVLRYRAPGCKLRLITSSVTAVPALQSEFLDSEVVVADYLDRDSLPTAVAGMEGIFVVTPSGLDETAAMTNLIDAVRAADAATHVVRIVGYEPESLPENVPKALADMGGDGTQHYVAKALLDRSGLPVTFLNCGASMMDNLLFTAPGIRRSRTLIWPQRWVPLIDSRDLAEIAARILLSDDARHITQFHTANNGYDHITTSHVADVMSDVFQVRIAHDGSKEGFLSEYGDMLNQRQGRDVEGEYRWQFIQFENSNAIVWSLNNFAERTLGRRPTTLHSWLTEHRHVFLDQPTHPPTRSVP